MKNSNIILFFTLFTLIIIGFVSSPNKSEACYNGYCNYPSSSYGNYYNTFPSYGYINNFSYINYNNNGYNNNYGYYKPNNVGYSSSYYNSSPYFYNNSFSSSPYNRVNTYNYNIGNNYGSNSGYGNYRGWNGYCSGYRC